MKKFKQQLQYRLDNLLSHSPAHQLLFLFLVALCISLLSGILLKLSSSGELGSFTNGFWWGMQKLVGLEVSEEMRKSLSFFAISIVMTVIGITLSGMIIAILSAKLEEKFQELRKGKSVVPETNHTLILGWNEKIFRIIEELILANESLRRGVIVVLADKDKETMETEIREKIDNFKTSIVVCRTGTPSDIKLLETVNFQDARSIIVLNNSKENDNGIIKTVLACVNHPKRPKCKLHIVTEANHAESVEVLKITGGDEIEIIVIEDIIPRLAVQISRQAGLSVVYEDFLNFAGNEFYICNFPQAAGKKFRELYSNFPQSIPVGIHKKSTDEILVNPPEGTLLSDGDSLILLSGDDASATYAESTRPVSNKEPDFTKKLITQVPEKILILGWNSNISLLLGEMDSYLKEGSQVDIVGKVAEEESRAYLQENTSLKNIQLSYIRKDYSRPAIVESLNPFSYNSILILAPETESDSVENMDAETISALLILRSISGKTENTANTKIVSEILNSHNKKLAAVTNINDFIISSEMISMLLAQISEDKRLVRVLNQIFSSEGSELYLKPASRYLMDQNEKATFRQIIERAFLHNETALGFLKFKEDGKVEAQLNPPKEQPISFGAKDQIAVLAENYFDV